jgi:hypothetical protein
VCALNERRFLGLGRAHGAACRLAIPRGRATDELLRAVVGPFRSGTVPPWRSSMAQRYEQGAWISVATWGVAGAACVNAAVPYPRHAVHVVRLCAFWVSVVRWMSQEQGVCGDVVSDGCATSHSHDIVDPTLGGWPPAPAASICRAPRRPLERGSRPPAAYAQRMSYHETAVTLRLERAVPGIHVFAVGTLRCGFCSYASLRSEPVTRGGECANVCTLQRHPRDALSRLTAQPIAAVTIAE